MRGGRTGHRKAGVRDLADIVTAVSPRVRLVTRVFVALTASIGGAAIVAIIWDQQGMDRARTALWTVAGSAAGAPRTAAGRYASSSWRSAAPAAWARVEWKKRMRQRAPSWRRTADSSQVTGVTVLPSEIEPRLT